MSAGPEDVDETDVEVSVQVTEPETSEEPESDDTTVVVVEDDGEDAVDAVIVQTELDHAGRLAALEVAVAGIIEWQVDAQYKIENAEFASQAATNAALEALDNQAEIEPVVDEIVQDAADGELDEIKPDDDAVPQTQRKHWLFR